MRRWFELGLFVAGLSAVVAGLAQVYRPAAYIGGGLLAIALAWLSRRAP